MSDEHAVALGPALSGAQATALRLVQKNVTPPTDLGDFDDGDDGEPKLTTKTKEGLSLLEAKSLLNKIEKEYRSVPSLRIDITWTVEGDQAR